MSKILTAVVASSFVAVLVALWATSQKVQRQQQEELRRLTGRLEELGERADAAAERQRVAPGTTIAPRDIPSPAAVGAPASLQEAEPTSVVPPSPTAAPSAVVRTREEIRDSAEAQFVAEAYDRSWSTEAVAQLRTKLASHLSHDSRLRSLECREALCRLETSHRDLKEFQAFQRDSLSAPDFGWEGPMLYAPLKTESSGEVVEVTFLTRPGRTPNYMESESE